MPSDHLMGNWSETRAISSIWAAAEENITYQYIMCLQLTKKKTKTPRLTYSFR